MHGASFFIKFTCFAYFEEGRLFDPLKRPVLRSACDSAVERLTEESPAAPGKAEPGRFGPLGVCTLTMAMEGSQDYK